MTDTSTTPVPPAAANGLWKIGSGKMGAAIVSVMVIIGFLMLTFFSVKPEMAGINDKSVLLFLLGSWSSLATTVVSYWVGSSSSSQDKSDKLDQIRQPK